MVRNIKKGRNGTILIAASFGGVFRYNPKRAVGKSFTNLTSKVGSRGFWNVLEDRRGNLWFASTDSGVYYYDPDGEFPDGQLRNPFEILQGKTDFRYLQLLSF